MPLCHKHPTGQRAKESLESVAPLQAPRIIRQSHSASLRERRRGVGLQMAKVAQEIIVKYTVVLQRENDGGYVVSVPALPGCISQGDTREEALKNIEEAIELYL